MVCCFATFKKFSVYMSMMQFILLYVPLEYSANAFLKLCIATRLTVAESMHSIQSPHIPFFSLYNIRHSNSVFIPVLQAVSDTHTSLLYSATPFLTLSSMHVFFSFCLLITCIVFLSPHVTTFSFSFSPMTVLPSYLLSSPSHA